MLVVLEVVVGSEVGRLIKIPQDQTCKVGRTNWADETFSDDVMMSGQHFEVQNDGKYCWLRDLDSRNGTRVDNDFVKENLVLRDGQTIFAGRTQFRIRIEGGAKNPYESTNFGTSEQIFNPALTFGSQAFSPTDPRFPAPQQPPADLSTPIPPAAIPPAPATRTPLPPGPPRPPGVPPVAGNNIELPPTAAAGIPPRPLPGAPEVPGQSPPIPATPGAFPSGNLPPGNLPPGNLPPGAAPPGAPPAWGPGQRGGDGPVFKFAKGGVTPPPFGSVPGTTTPGGSVPGSPVPGAPVPGSPVPGNPTPGIGPRSFPAPPGAPPTPPGFPPPISQPPTPPGFPPAGNLATPPGAPSFDSDWESSDSLPPLDVPPAGFSSPGGTSKSDLPAWSPAEGLSPASNPNLDFGDVDDWEEEDAGLGSGPVLDFEHDVNDDPKLGSPLLPGLGGSSFNKPGPPAGINPNLVDWDEVPPSQPLPPTPANFTPPPSDNRPPSLPPLRAEPNPNWRNPDYAALQPQTPAADVPPVVPPGKPSADSVHGLCFQEETADSGYPLYQCVLEGVPQAPFSPFALVSQIATLARPVLAIHFMRAERPIPDGLEGVPLRADLDAKFAALGGPMLYAPSDLEPFREIIDQLWGLDAISIMFTSGDPQAIIDHFRKGLFAPKRGDLPEPSPAPGPQFFAVFSPNLLTTFLSARDQETVDELLGPPIEAVLTEVADMPDSWQLFTKKPWADRLKKLGMNRVVAQPQ